jgi:cysteine desulfurase / selenocysteine lyase
LGALPLDIRACGIDILTCDGRTWLLGGDGSGFLYVRHDLLDQLQPGAYVGDESVIGPQHDYNFTLQPNAERFNIGSASPLGVLGLNAALGLLHEVGIPAISARILDLIDMLIGDLRERGYRIRSPFTHRHRSASVFVDLPDPPRAHERLRAAHVIAAQMPGGLRFSPHFYNSEHDILCVGEILGNAR